MAKGELRNVTRGDRGGSELLPLGTWSTGGGKLSLMLDYQGKKGGNHLKNKYKTCSGGAAWSPALPPAHLQQQGRVCRAPEQPGALVWLHLLRGFPEFHPDPPFQQHHLEPGPALAWDIEPGITLVLVCPSGCTCCGFFLPSQHGLRGRAGIPQKAGGEAAEEGTLPCQGSAPVIPDFTQGQGVGSCSCSKSQAPV